MTKKKSTKSAAARRREQIRQREEKRQNRLIMTGGGVLALLLIIFVVWQVAGAVANRADTGGTAVTDTVGGEACPGERLASERPLAALPPEARDAYYDAYPDMMLEDGRQYYAQITTEKGVMCLQLLADAAPLAVNSFVFLATQGFYDDVTFHRVLPDFMAQGGDPTGTGMGGPGYQFANETSPDLLFNRRGLLAMANAGPDTNGSQFFITFAPAANLNGGYTVFGELTAGDDVLANIDIRDPQLFPGEPGDSIQRIDIYTTES